MRDQATEMIAGTLLVCAIFAQTSGVPEQGWKLKRGGSKPVVDFTLEHAKDRGRWIHSTDVPLERFRRLNPDSLRSGGPANFEYVSDAGTLVCEGRFRLGRGSGTWTFRNNPAFAAELQSLGYEQPDAGQLLSMMMADITLEFARTVKDALPAATTKDLLDLQIHHVNASYLKKLRDFGMTSLTAADVARLKMHGVE